MANFGGAMRTSQAEINGDLPSLLDWAGSAPEERGVYPPNGVRIEDAAIASGTPALESPSGLFLPEHVGLRVRIDGAGVGGAIFRATIMAYVSPTEVTLDDDADTTVTASHARWGPSGTAAIFMAAIENAAIRCEGKGTVFGPSGFYVIDEPIVWTDGVTLVGPNCHTRFGFNAAWKFLTCCIATGADFPADSPMIDMRGCRNTGLHFVELVGDGTAALNQTDATSRGILLGSAEQADGVEFNWHSILFCSIINQAYGIWNKLANGVNLDYNNFGNNWKVCIYGEKYAFNDRTPVGNMINSSRWEADPADHLANNDGIGIWLGYGCAHQTWIGGKIEFNRVGVRLDVGCFGIRFKGVVFDANAAHHAHIKGQPDKEDILTESHTFEGCMFMGGGYAPNAISDGHEGHILVEGIKSTFECIPVSLNVIGCMFRATVDGKAAYWGLTAAGPGAPNKYPKDAVIRAIATGSGVGKPTLRLNLVGCDAFDGSVRSGMVDISGAVVTHVSGDQFSTAWTGIPFFHFWFSEYTVVQATSSTSLTLNTSAGPVTDDPYHVNTNGVLISPDFSGFSEIICKSNIGIPDFHKRSFGENRDLFVLHDQNDLTFNPVNARIRIENNGRSTIRGAITGRGLEVERDMSELINIGRFSSGYGGAVLDAASRDGLTHPTFLSVRVGNNEYLRVVGPGIQAPYVGVGTAPGGDFELDVAGDGRVSGAFRLSGFSTKNRFVYADADGFLIPGKVKLYDATQVDVASMTDEQFTLRSGTALATGKVQLNYATQVTLGGSMSDGVVLAALGDVISFYTLAGFASNIQGLIDFHAIPGLDDALDDLQDQIDTLSTGKADIGHGHSGTTGSTAGHTHGISL